MDINSEVSQMCTRATLAPRRQVGECKAPGRCSEWRVSHQLVVQDGRYAKGELRPRAGQSIKMARGLSIWLCEQ